MSDWFSVAEDVDLPFPTALLPVAEIVATLLPVAEIVLPLLKMWRRCNYIIALLPVAEIVAACIVACASG